MAIASQRCASRAESGMIMVWSEEPARRSGGSCVHDKDAEPFGQTTHPIPIHPLGRCTHGSGADLEALILQHLLDGDLLKAVTQKGFRG